MADESFLLSLVNLVSDVVWEIDNNMRFVYLSFNSESDIGYSSSELIGVTFDTLMSREEGDRVLNFLDEKVKKGFIFRDYPVTIYGKYKRIRFMNISGFPFFDKDGILQGVRGIAYRFNEVAPFKYATIRQKSQLPLLPYNFPGVIYSISFNEELIVKDISGGLYELTGYGPSDIIGKKVLSETFVHPDDVEKLSMSFNNITEEKSYFELLHRIVTLYGEVKWVMSKGYGIFRNEEMESVDGFFIDVTETRNAVRRSKVSEKKFRNLFENNPQGIAIVDSRGFISKANLAWKNMFGYPENHEGDIHFLDYRHEVNKFSDMHLFNALFNGDEKSYRVEREFQRLDNTTFWCDLTVTLMKDSDSGSFIAIGVYIDITEKKSIEDKHKCFHKELEVKVAERTEEVNRLTRKVIDSEEGERLRIARDLHDGVGQTMLAAKYAISSFMKNSVRDEKLLSRGLQLMDKASQELREVCSGIYPSMLDELGLNHAVAWLIRNFLETSGIKVCYTVNYNRVVSDYQALHIFRIIQELFNNIIKHSRADSVNVELSSENDLLSVKVADNGIGFNGLYAMKKTNGTGLINIKQRVNNLMGSLDIESGNRMTTVIVKVPLVAL